MKVNPIEVQKHLRGISYPADKDEVVSTAESNDAPEEIVDALRSMDRERFDSPSDVQEALG
jgi:Protein of unknown function (DUF2795)